jgi:hypothetical protein
MVPRQRCETRRPVFPSVLYSMRTFYYQPIYRGQVKAKLRAPHPKTSGVRGGASFSGGPPFGAVSSARNRVGVSGGRSRAGTSLAPLTSPGNKPAKFPANNSESMAWPAVSSSSTWLLQNSANPSEARPRCKTQVGTIRCRRWQEPTLGARRTRNTSMETSARPLSPSGRRCAQRSVNATPFCGSAPAKSHFPVRE